MRYHVQILLACMLYFVLMNSSILNAQEDQLDLYYTLDLGLPPGGLNTSRIGAHVSILGDINGDGYDDWASVGGADYVTGTGMVSIHFFLGGPDRLQEAAVADYIIYGTPAIQVGNGVWKAGDVNGDGFDDVLLYCYYAYETGGEYVHALYFGGEPFDTEPDILLRKLENHPGIANQSSDAGDVNNDGYDDVLLSISTSIGSVDTAHVYLFYGGETMDDIPDVILAGTVIPPGLAGGAKRFGGATAAGDVNNDDFDDIIIATYQGAELFFGGDPMDKESDALFTDFRGAGFGAGPIVADAGDLNNDGYADILMTANVAQTKAIICYGDSIVDTVPDVVIPMWTTETYYGISASCAGDVNNDGFDDLILGTMTFWPIEQGEARIYYGGAAMDSVADYSVLGPPYNVFGFTVAGDGDFNGDGYSDYLVGDIGNAGTIDKHDEAGSISLFYGGEILSAIPAAFYEGVAAEERFGWSVAHAGDVNKDGYPDILVGAPNHYGRAKDAAVNYYSGRAYLFLGSETPDNEVDLILDTETPYNGDQRFFGDNVGSCGDINNDGFSDFYVTEKYRIAVFLGGSEPDSIADYVFSTNTTAYTFCAPGDVNNDGCDDILFGKPGDGIGGTVYLYLGGDNLMDGVDVTLSGLNSGDAFGKSMIAAGDLNNDGFDDFLISAPGNDQIKNNGGAVYVYFGAASISDTAGLIIYRNFEGPTYDSERIAGDGDINNDGYSDIVIGNPYFSKSASSYEGMVQIYYGGTDMDDVADIEWTGSAGKLLGSMVEFFPDMNYDGFDDLFLDNNIYYGAAEPDTTVDIASPFTSLPVAAFQDSETVYFAVGNAEHHGPGLSMGRVSVYSTSVLNTRVAEAEYAKPAQYTLAQNYPNPFNPITTINYQLPVTGQVELSIYNILGQKVATLVSGQHAAGRYKVNWNASGFSSGIYFYKLETQDNVLVRRMLLIK